MLRLNIDYILNTKKSKNTCLLNSIQIRIKFKSRTVAATTMVHLGALWELVAVAGMV